MGVAAYNRGSTAIARQLQPQYGAAWERGARDNRIQMLIGRAERAEHDLERAKRLIRLLRAEKACLRDDLASEREAHDATRGFVSRMWQSLGSVRRSWQKASALLRLLPPNVVNELRAERDATE
jgi:hypothetical protein